MPLGTRPLYSESQPSDHTAAREESWRICARLYSCVRAGGWACRAQGTPAWLQPGLSNTGAVGMWRARVGTR